MGKIKKSLALILVVLISLFLVPIPEKCAKAAEESDKVYVKIRYCKKDSDYNNWNLWVWEKNKEGKQVNFSGEDDEGKFAVVETTKESESLNFIIRKGDWQEKATEDEKVDLQNGNVEITISEKDSGINREDKVLNTDFAKVNLKLHYYRYKGDYEASSTEGWVNEGDKQDYDFKDTDDYGKVVDITKENINGSKDISFIIKNDIANERKINLAYANNKGEINDYILQNDPNVYYYKDQPIRNPKITYFKLDSLNEMTFKVNSEIKDYNDIVLKENGVSISGSRYKIGLNSDNLGGKIFMRDCINLNSTYTLEIPNYESLNSSYGNILGTKTFEELYKYNGDLGAIYSPYKTKFILWAPTATDVKVILYGKDGKDYLSAPQKIIDMAKGNQGEWTYEEAGNLDGVYYNYLVSVDGQEKEVVDPYAKAVGVNGNRGMVINLSTTNPEGWNEDKRPVLNSPTDAVIYEMHIRDFSIDENSGASLEYRGKYNGVWQKNTVLPGSDIKTGIDHLKELGVNTVQILPMYDYATVDETKENNSQYNWGYDPKNYNVPEGSYSTNPYDGKIRIQELKKMINELHKNGIKVIMDVVYNHTFSAEDSSFQKAVPDYYYRHDSDGNFTNGSGCGNEVATERYMVRKFIVDSLKYWVTEYHMDGFRFDLMGVYDIETMNKIRSELDKIDPAILMYGEGWTGGTSQLPDEQKAIKANCKDFGTSQIGMFSDDLRDGLKGHVFTENAPGFINGQEGFEDTIKFGIVASTEHGDIDYDKVNYSKEPWANEPYQTITYVTCHDNYTLYDRLQKVEPNASEGEKLDMYKLAAAIVYTSQGIPFMQAGEEFARSKCDEHGNLIDNSYNSSDTVNKLDWNRLKSYNNLYEYYKGLLNLRNNHKAFRMNSEEDIQNNLKFLENGKDFNGNNVVAYILNGAAVGDNWGNIAVMFNASDKDVDVTLPMDDWTLIVNKDKAGVDEIEKVKGNKITLPANTSYILVDTISYEKNK